MSLRLITPHDPNDPVLTFREFLMHTRMDSDDASDVDSEKKLKAAIRKIEHETGRALLESTWEWSFERFPCAGEAGDRPRKWIYLELPKMQVQSVSSIVYTNSAGVTSTFASSRYQLVGGYSKLANPTQVTYSARIALKYNEQWPVEPLQWGEPVVVTFVCGWDVPASVPDDLKNAIMLEAAHLLRDRESITVDRLALQSVPLARGVESLISPYMDPRF